MWCSASKSRCDAGSYITESSKRMEPGRYARFVKMLE